MSPTLYWLVDQEGHTRGIMRDELVSELRKCRKAGQGVKVILGVLGEFSKDGMRFRCGPEEFSLADDETEWFDSSKEWKHDDKQ